MAQGIVSAKLVLLLVVGILYLLTITKPAYATDFTVGDAKGWTFNVKNWPEGKSFKAGDVLAFNYDKERHNVVVVSKEGYDKCYEPTPSKIYQTGNEKISLASGPNYFICSFPSHCHNGVKIAVNAS
ncbi:basic blue protein-like [Spinacia oleracea]|uniref:Basic blue protein-like n=1 Tax=Spinacia oleracea TaxID=3562 RepID=A0A9R0J0R3_SPIOL|nr:basic blue protein-like [Spinacia oleracea]